MKDFNKKLVRDNIFLLLHFSGITDEQFSNILGVSLRWFRYIKSGKYDFKIDEIEKASNFFDTPFFSITSKTLKPSRNFRSKLIITHKTNTEFLAPLLEPPTIPYAIEFLLLDDYDFDINGLEIKDINRIFEKKGWRFKSSSISNALKQMTHLISIQPHPTKGGTNLYSKKN